MSIDSGILEEFAIEAGELLDEAEEALLKIDKEQDLKKIYDLVFRAFHSLKGSAGMLGFEELQRHMHLLEDYLQKSKEAASHFKSSVDYYLSGIDAARRILKGEVVQFIYEVYKDKKTPDVVNLQRKKILYLSDSKVKPLGQEIASLEQSLGFSMTFSSREDLKDENRASEEYDILISDFSIDILKAMIPARKLKYPIILIIDQIDPDFVVKNVFQVLKKSDEKTRVYLTIKNALEAHLNLELFDKAKGLLMYMYGGLEEYLVCKNELDTQSKLSAEIRSFIVNYTR